MTMASESQNILSSRKRRIAAYIIDHFVLTFLIIATAFISLGTDFLNEPNFNTMTATLLAVLLPGFFLYFAKDSFKGISIGKWIMGIMVRDAGNPELVPPFGRLLIRNLPLIIWPIEVIVLATNKPREKTPW